MFRRRSNGEHIAAEVTIRLSPELFAEAQRAASERGLSLGIWISSLVTREVGAHKAGVRAKHRRGHKRELKKVLASK